ncbi:hypothetical protein BY996DRAFT_6410241 [Phakopsora pachyrhizi]|nr:hypothetical protein BY996DRAFT_6410241 [Phakopsora pachyrhizi]
MSNSSFSPVNNSKFDSACYKAKLPLNAIGWNQFKFLLHESTNSSEARFHEVNRTVKDVYITGYVSNDPVLQKNQRFALKDKDTFEKWKLSVAKHPKAEIGVKILTPNPKERLENQKRQFIIWVVIVSEFFDGRQYNQGKNEGTDGSIVPPWIAQPGMPFGLGHSSTRQQPRIPSPELPPQEGDYSFDRFLGFAGLNHLESFEQNHLHNNGLDNIKVLLRKHTTYD